LQRCHPYTEYGKKVAIRLLDMGNSQAWLIEQIHARVPYSVDSSNLNRILTGRIKTSRLIPIIDSILFPEDTA
jgi:hypothetical protein